MTEEFDFTSVIERRGKDAIALDALYGSRYAPRIPDTVADPIPMWVADMNFAVPPCITDAIRERLDHPLFGYFEPRREYYESIIRWQKLRHGMTDLLPEQIGYENGVLGGLVSALRALCEPGEEVLVHSPTYVGFTSSMTGAGYRLLLSELKKDGDGIYRMDFEDMERKIESHRIRCAVFCSPHNPAGRVWERREIEQAMELFRRHGVYVISDEIWADLVLPGHTHIPTSSISEDAKERTVSLYAPTKTFNLAGLVGSYHIIQNRDLRERIEKAGRATHYNSMNVLSMYALIGAYSEQGARWLDRLVRVLETNLSEGIRFLEREFPGTVCTRPEGTYMLFVDFTDYCAGAGISLDELLGRVWNAGVAIQDGRPFHGACHSRMNFALPYSRVTEALDRMRKALP